MSQSTAKWLYTNIQHVPRMHLGITPNEYCVLDLFYQDQVSPKYGINGWSKNSYSRISSYLGFSKSSLHKMVDRFVAAGLMEVDETDSQLKRTTEAWYGVAYEKNHAIFDEKPAVRKANAKDLPFDKRTAAVRKANASRSISERHYKEERKEKEKKKGKGASPQPPTSFSSSFLPNGKTLDSPPSPQPPRPPKF